MSSLMHKLHIINFMYYMQIRICFASKSHSIRFNLHKNMPNINVLEFYDDKYYISE